MVYHNYGVYRRPTFHFLTSSRLLPDSLSSLGGANSTSVVAVWWSGQSHVLHYSLLRPIKDVDAGVADLVWPMSSRIACSAASQCSQLLAVALHNNDIVVWNRDTGMCARTVKVSECGRLSSLHFISSNSASAAYVAHDAVTLSLIVGSSTGHIFTVSCEQRSSTLPQSVYVDIEDDREVLDMIHPVLGMPQLMVVCCKDGRLFVCDVLKGNFVCELVKPASDVTKLGRPLEPLAFTAVDNGRAIYAIAKLHPQPDEEKSEVDADDAAAEEEEVSELEAGKSWLLVYRIMFFPSFDCYSFPGCYHSSVVGTASRQTMQDPVTVSGLLQARLADHSERISRLQKRWFELKELTAHNLAVQTTA